MRAPISPIWTVGIRVSLLEHVCSTVQRSATRMAAGLPTQLQWTRHNSLVLFFVLFFSVFILGLLFFGGGGGGGGGLGGGVYCLSFWGGWVHFRFVLWLRACFLLLFLLLLGFLEGGWGGFFYCFKLYNKYAVYINKQLYSADKTCNWFYFILF